jgi:hypothetical protein
MSNDENSIVALVGAYSLPSAIGVDANCFGQTFPIVLGTLTGTITLPQVTWAESKPKVIAPLPPGPTGGALERWIDQTYNGWELFHFWGDVPSYKPAEKELIQSYVSAFLLNFSVDKAALTYSNCLYGRGHPQGELITSIFNEIDVWFDRVRTWTEVCVDQDLDYEAPVTVVSRPGNGLSVVAMDDEGVSLPSTGNHIVVTMSSDELLTLPKFIQIVDLANKGALPSAAHCLVRDGHAAFRRKQYRRVVIDAGTATELSLADFNQSSVHATTPPNPTLGWYARDTMIATQAMLPTNTVTDLVEVRNKAIHENRVPTRAGALQAL